MAHYTPGHVERSHVERRGNGCIWVQGWLRVGPGIQNTFRPETLRKFEKVVVRGLTRKESLTWLNEPSKSGVHTPADVAGSGEYKRGYLNLTPELTRDALWTFSHLGQDEWNSAIGTAPS